MPTTRQTLAILLLCKELDRAWYEMAEQEKLPRKDRRGEFATDRKCQDFLSEVMFQLYNLGGFAGSELADKCATDHENWLALATFKKRPTRWHGFFQLFQNWWAGKLKIRFGFSKNGSVVFPSETVCYSTCCFWLARWMRRQHDSDGRIQQRIFQLDRWNTDDTLTWDDVALATRHEFNLASFSMGNCKVSTKAFAKTYKLPIRRDRGGRRPKSKRKKLV